MKKNTPILVIGGTTRDFTFQAPQSFSSIKPGDKTYVTQSLQSIGGGGANAARSFASLESNVTLYSALGKDHNAQQVFKILKKYQINTHYIQQYNQPTGHSFIVTTPANKDRQIFSFRGANESIILKAKVLQNYPFIHISSLSYNAYKELSNIYFSNEQWISCNPSATLLKDYDLAAKIFAQCNMISMNNEELLLFTQKMNDSATLNTRIQKLHDLGVAYVIVSNGAQGTHASDGSQLIYMPGTKKVISTLGAGDTFASTCSFMLQKRKDLHCALWCAQKQTNFTLETVESFASGFTYKELIALYKKNKPKKI